MFFVDWVRVSICPSLSSHIFPRSQQNDHHHLIFLQQKKKKRNRQTKAKETSRESKPIVPPEKRNTSTSAFQSGGSLTFSPEPNCLFYWLASFLSLGLQLICRKTTFDEANELSDCVRITNSSRKKVVSPKSELPSTSEQPSTVVRSISQFERHCCPGASIPVLADDGDSSSPSSGSILPSIIFSIQTLASNDIPKQRDRGLDGWASAVQIGATMAGAAARHLLSMMMRLNLGNSSLVQPPISFRKISILCFDHSCSDSEISFFNAFTSAHMLAVVSSGVGNSRLWNYCPSHTLHRSKL